MKSIAKTFLFLWIILTLSMGMAGNTMVSAQDEDPTATPIFTLTPTPPSTGTSSNTATNTAIPLDDFSRPLIVINSYSYGDTVTPGTDFNLTIQIKNNGGSNAYNLVATFESADFLPLGTGGVLSISSLDSGATGALTQPLRANSALWGSASGSVAVNVNYTDSEGTPYTERFTITINLEQPSSTPTNTAIPPVQYLRPLIALNSYSYGDTVTPGTDFTLKLRVKNNGGSNAYNLVATFESADFLPLETGGVRSINSLDSGDAEDISQPLRANYALWGSASGLVAVNVNYTDSEGTLYTEKFNITINLKQYSGSSAATATPTSQPRAQLVVGGYEIDVNPLQPGSIFNLKVTVRNLGSVDAADVTMVLGGGGTGTDGSGTPTGGLSGGGSDLTNFAPLGSSNLIYLDKVMRGEPKEAEVQLIVNVSATPGAYPFKISFVYTDSKGDRVVDDQVITLLVYSLPKVELSFYRDPGILFAGQMTQLPIQITNLGKSTAILGNMVVSSEGADLSENVSLVGALEQGGYFTLDAMAMPYAEGPLDIKIVVSYTDDFNQPRTVEQVLTLQVEAAPVIEPLPDDGSLPVIEQPETMTQKIVRFLKGLIGLGSAKPDLNSGGLTPGMEGEFQSDGTQKEEIQVEPLPSGKG
jgi:hypothetical protein